MGNIIIKVKKKMSELYSKINWNKNIWRRILQCSIEYYGDNRFAINKWEGKTLCRKKRIINSGREQV